jgi:glycosyltransferase involved in cell wall biosynthesis
MTKSKKILFIAPASFPIMGAESIVNAKLLKALAESGYDIDVISKNMKWANYPYQQLNEFGVSLHSLTVIGVENKLNFKTIIWHILAFITFGIVYKGAHWAFLALKKAKQLVENNSYDFVLTKNAPAELIGYYLKRKFGLKWIATWNDPYPTEKYPEPYGQGIKAKVFFGASRLIPIMNDYPDIHVFTSIRLRNYMLQYLNVAIERTFVIHHIVLPMNDLKSTVTHECLKMIHTGNVSSPRNPEPFLHALHLFFIDNPDAFMEIAFMGVLPENFSHLLI